MGERAWCWSNGRVSSRPQHQDYEGDRPCVRLSPSDGGRGDSTLPYAVSSRSATELTWGMKKDGRQTSQQNRRQALSNPAPSSVWRIRTAPILPCTVFVESATQNRFKKGSTLIVRQHGRHTYGLPLNSQLRNGSDKQPIRMAARYVTICHYDKGDGVSV